MHSGDLRRFEQSLAHGIQRGLHIGVQASVAFAGTTTDLVMGESRAGVPMAVDTLMIWLSATKPITAVAIAQLWERGRLSLDDSAAAYVPEFAAHDKSGITIRHLLTHTAGIRGAVNNFTKDDWSTTLARVCDARIEPGWIPGKKAGYHLASTWLLLGEIVRKIDGRRFEQYIREEIFLPLGMPDSWCGLPMDQYQDYGDRIGIMTNTDPAGKLPHAWDTPLMASLCKPGGNGRGPARQLLRFYQMLQNGGALDGARIISPQTVEALTSRARVGMFDHTFKHVMDWGLGFVVNNNQYGADEIRYGYGPYASWRTFGHSGHQSSIAFCDPSRNLSAAIIFNGTPGEAAHDQRVRAALSGLYEDLGIQGSLTMAADEDSAR